MTPLNMGQSVQVSVDKASDPKYYDIVVDGLTYRVRSTTLENATRIAKREHNDQNGRL